MTADETREALKLALRLQHVLRVGRRPSRIREAQEVVEELIKMLESESKGDDK